MSWEWAGASWSEGSDLGVREARFNLLPPWPLPPSPYVWWAPQNISSCWLAIGSEVKWGGSDLGVRGYWARWQQAKACSPHSQITPLTPKSLLSLPSHSTSLPMANEQLAMFFGSPPHLGVRGQEERWEKAKAGSPHSQITPLAPSSLQLTPSLPPPPSSLQLTPACSGSLPTCSSSLPPPSSLQLAPTSQLTPAHSQLAPARSHLPAHSSSLPAHSQWPMYVWGSPPPLWCKGLGGKVGASWRELGNELEWAEWTERYTRF